MTLSSERLGEADLDGSVHHPASHLRNSHLNRSNLAENVNVLKMPQIRVKSCNQHATSFLAALVPL